MRNWLKNVFELHKKWFEHVNIKEVQGKFSVSKIMPHDQEIYIINETVFNLEDCWLLSNNNFSPIDNIPAGSSRKLCLQSEFALNKNSFDSSDGKMKSKGQQRIFEHVIKHYLGNRESFSGQTKSFLLGWTQQTPVSIKLPHMLDVTYYPTFWIIPLE